MVAAMEEAGEGRRGWIRRAVVVAGVVGICCSTAAHRRFGATLVKVESELGDVNKMLQENAQQFSLGAYTEDAEVRTRAECRRPSPAHPFFGANRWTQLR